MATHHGNGGVVRVGANSVAEVQQWSLTERVDIAEDHSMGDAWKTHLTGVKSWDGSVQCWFDETDTNGQQALTVGASVTLNLYPEGTGSGATYKTGTITITEITLDDAKDGIVTRAFNFVGNGALTETTVGA
jgi:hypothetical protein